MFNLKFNLQISIWCELLPYPNTLIFYIYLKWGKQMRDAHNNDRSDSCIFSTDNTPKRKSCKILKVSLELKEKTILTNIISQSILQKYFFKSLFNFIYKILFYITISKSFFKQYLDVKKNFFQKVLPIEIRVHFGITQYKINFGFRNYLMCFY